MFQYPLTGVPVVRSWSSSHHRKRRADRDRTAENHKPVGWYSRDQVAYGHVTNDSGYGSRQEEDRSLRSRVLLHVLEVEGQDCFDRVETSPGEEDRDADSCEDSVSPEGIGHDCWLAQSLLPADPEDEQRYQREC